MTTAQAALDLVKDSAKLKAKLEKLAKAEKDADAAQERAKKVTADEKAKADGIRAKLRQEEAAVKKQKTLLAAEEKALAKREAECNALVKKVEAMMARCDRDQADMKDLRERHLTIVADFEREKAAFEERVNQFMLTVQAALERV